MFRRIRLPVLVLAAGLVLGAGLRGDEKAPYTGAGCAAPVDDFFADEVWAKVGAQTCLTCHKAGGDAEDSKFVLRDPRKSAGRGPGRGDAAQPRRLRPDGRGSRRRTSPGCC